VAQPGFGELKKLCSNFARLAIEPVMVCPSVHHSKLAGTRQKLRQPCWEGHQGAARAGAWSDPRVDPK